MGERKQTFVIENVEEDSDVEDYLQDPEMCGDRLPQPYKMIERVLNELLDMAWESIEHRAALQQRQKAEVKLPDSNPGSIMCKDVLKSARGGVCKGREVMFVGSGKCIYVIKSTSEIIAKYDFQRHVCGLSAISTSEAVDMVFVQLETGTWLPILLHKTLILILFIQK